jgi:type I restriction enzyme, S subunit
VSGLPCGWVATAVGHIAADVSYGYTAKATNQPVGPHMLRITDVQDNRVDWSKVPYCTISANAKPRYLLRRGDLLFARTGATVGKSFRIAGDIPESVFASYLIRVRCEVASLSRYLGHFFRSRDYWSQVTDFSAGIGQPNVNGTKLREIRFPLAPAQEQHRIVDKLDAILARVDACRERLDRVPAILKKFRESVLEAAVSGRLTEEILENVELADVADVIDPHPSHRTPPEMAGGVPYVGIGDIGIDGRIDFATSRKVNRAVLDQHRERYTLRVGDFVFGKIGTLGRATPLPIPQDYTISANVLLIQPRKDNVQSTYLRLVLSAPSILQNVFDTSSATSQAAFGIKKMRSLTVSLPPLARQGEIVRRVDELFSLADGMERRYREVVARVEKLTPAVLAKAFRGELVPQDPEDEPASVLLERIRAERATKEGLAGKGAGRRAGPRDRGRLAANSVRVGAGSKKKGRRVGASSA